MRGAHPEHAVHARDAGRVEAQRLVERRCDLPSRKEGVRRGARCGPGGGRAWAGSTARERHARRENPDESLGARAYAERTANM
eukprot:scaffold94142_cov54-Phaeocystis_antarctica.AAC.3